MDKINLQSVYELGYALRRLTGLSGEQSWAQLTNFTYEAEKILKSLKEGNPIPLTES